MDATCERFEAGAAAPSAAGASRAVDVAGSTFLVRAGSASDADALAELRRELVARERSRSRAVLEDVVAHAVAATDLWHEGSVTLVAERDGAVVAAARYSPVAGTPDATVALAVADFLGQRELGGELVAELARVAHSRGVEHFVADLHPSNAPMLAVFVRAGFATEIAVGDGMMRMCFGVDPEERDTRRPVVRATPAWDASFGACGPAR